MRMLLDFATLSAVLNFPLLRAMIVSLDITYFLPKLAMSKFCPAFVLP